MTRFLISDTNPDGHTLEDLLPAVRGEILTRCTTISEYNWAEPKYVPEKQRKNSGVIEPSH
ncbi:MAG: hypothetical protein ACJ0HN_05005 [Alphaproteobacteria bacterium]